MSGAEVKIVGKVPVDRDKELRIFEWTLML
jgi:hypothetical protein